MEGEEQIGQAFGEGSRVEFGVLREKVEEHIGEGFERETEELYEISCDH